MAVIDAQRDESTMYETVVAANVITAAESGKTFLLNLDGGFASTLPTPAVGLEFTFIVHTKPSTAYTITSTTAILNGYVNGANTIVPIAAKTTLTIVAANTKKGDWVKVVSDGTSWYISGQGSTAGAFTVA